MDTKTIEAKKEYLTKEHFKEFISMDVLEFDKKIYIVNFDYKFLIVKREGICDYKKCKNACCKFVDANYLKDYSRGFFDEKDEFGKYWLKRKCNNLSKCGKCKLWKKKGFPIECKQFPHPSDTTYWRVLDKCTFKFRILHTINKVGKGIREEMIKCFEEQQ